MRDADTVLGIICARGQAGLPLEDIYRQLYNPHLWLRAYDRLRRNTGALTPGATTDTVDGMSTEKIGRYIEALRYERYQWTPVRRVYIPKKNGTLRALGLPTWSDKLLQEVMRSILEAYYEPQFSPLSHGFRPNRGCHTALCAIRDHWAGTKWFIEGDISKCFDMLDHHVLMEILREKLKDNRFLRLIENMLKAGYLEDWRWNITHSGAPQGGVISPILSNIYLGRLDKYVEGVLIPQTNRGKRRAEDPRYAAVRIAIGKAKKEGNVEHYRQLVKQRRELPSVDANDPNYRRLTYVRYADDFLLGFVGPKAEAEGIKQHVRAFMREELKLELSSDKTLITHAHDDAARFLGYDIQTYRANDRLDPVHGKRSVTGKICLRVPHNVKADKCRHYMREGKPCYRPELLHGSDYDIMLRFQMEYTGMVQYYLLAQNVASLGYLHHVMRIALVKTLAAKHRTSARAVIQQHAVTIQTEHGRRKCLQVEVPRPAKPPLVVRFGGLPLRRKTTARLEDLPAYTYHGWRSTDALKRMLADTCELCGARGGCEVHHIRRLADLHKQGRREKPHWMKVMIAKRRKTLVVCTSCHADLHAGRPLRRSRELESRVSGN